MDQRDELTGDEFSYRAGTIAFNTASLMYFYNVTGDVDWFTWYLKDIRKVQSGMGGSGFYTGQMIRKARRFLRKHMR